ncbi:MAG: thioredoxin domain-containing protein [Nitrospirae bacterium]|nr:thioredoxin domain-containing protein [Nitrospirota bacterium]
MAKNRLKDENSPYLLQHADNPVNWYAWSEEALKAAVELDKPIFLSIGYSTCHWCHVMKRECFEDPEVAALMNDTFISIKLDREERPDIDNIYMTACQMMTGGGGWPLTMIMLPDGRPFFAGTYIPKHNSGSIAGMMFLVPRVKHAWQHERQDLIGMAQKITDLLREHAASDKASVQRISEIVQKTYDAIESTFDKTNGGFGGAPKFPVAHNILFLLEYYRKAGQDSALAMVNKTLHSMRMGGIYDHIGGGFHRYSTDSAWHVPHFEKMLYDQALLLMAYAAGCTAASDKSYKRTAYEIIAYAMRDMLSPEGAFYCAQDAESEGVEGKFYLWSTEELHHALTTAEAEVIMDVFGINAASQDKDISHCLHMMKSEAELTEGQRALLTAAIEKLSKERQKRIPPHKDDKILTDLNGLMAAALVRAGMAFKDDTLIAAAARAVEFIERKMAVDSGSLMHRYRDGHMGIAATVNDYACVTWALIELYEATHGQQYLLSAKKYMDYLIDHFWDFEAGGLYFTDKASQALIVRQKEFYDGAVPSGNSIALYNMIRLAGFLGDDSLIAKSYELIDAAQATRQPGAHTMLAFAASLAPERKG